MTNEASRKMRAHGRTAGPGKTRSGRTPAMRLLTLFLAAFAILAGPIGDAPAPAQLRVQVVGENYIPLRIASPDFDASGPGGAEAAAQMAQGLRQAPGGAADSPLTDENALIEGDLDLALAPRFPDWTVIEAQALVVGNVLGDASNNNVAVQLRLYTVFGGVQQFATQSTVQTPL